MPVVVAPVPPEGAHEYVYGPVPPAPAAVAEPLFPPLQATGVDEVMDAVRAVGCVMATEAVAVQPKLSVMVQV
jgi:hypothetical protein